MATAKRKPNGVRRTITDDFNNQSVCGVFSEFIQEKQAIGLSQKTIEAYKGSYKKFDSYFGDKADDTGNITASMFVEWTSAMRSDGLASPSINHYLTDMRAFMYWCMADERKYIEPFKIKTVKEQETPPKDYSLEEVNLLLRRPDKKESFTTWRCWATVCFVIGTGARIGTIVEIQMKDINLKDGKVFYQHTKNKKLQVANMPPQLVKSLKEYISLWRSDAEEDDYLFCNISNEKITTDAMRIAYANYTRDRGVKKTNLHGLRHTFAREWYLNGGDIVQLSKVLGHSSIRMSEHYMNIYADEAKEAFNQFNPLENISKGRGNRKAVKRNG